MDQVIKVFSPSMQSMDNRSRFSFLRGILLRTGTTASPPNSLMAILPVSGGEAKEMMNSGLLVLPMTRPIVF